MNKFLRTFEHFLGLVMIVAIFGLATLSVWSLSPIAKENLQVAGLSSDDQTVPANDLTNLKKVDVELIPSLTDEQGDAQVAYTGEREFTLRVKLNEIAAGATLVGRLEIANPNLFAFPVRVELVSFDDGASSKVVAVLAASNGKHQLSKFTAATQPLLVALPAGEEPSVMLLELVASENINFESELEIKFSY